MSRFAVTTVACCTNPLSVVTLRSFERELRREPLLDRIQAELDEKRRIRMCVACRSHGETAFDAAAQALYAMGAVDLRTLPPANSVRQLEVTILGVPG